MKKTFLPLSLVLLTVSASAQQPAIARERWDPKPAIHHLDDRYSKESAVILLDKRVIEYVEAGNDNIAEYATLHRIIRVNDDKGIESFNKVYLPYIDSTDIVDMQARAILPNGAVKEVSRGDMKDFKNDDGRTFKIFAMEGLEKGSEIEFYYTSKHKTEFFGDEALQGAYPVLDATLEIRSPERLEFQLKGDNCTPPITDTVLNGTRVLSTKLSDIPGAEHEKYAAYEVNLRQIEYRLSYSNANGGEHIRLNTWNTLAQRVHEFYETFSGKDLGRVGDLVDDNGWQKLPGDPEKIMAVENYLKKEFTTREDIDNENAGNIEWMIKNKIASHHGIVRLYAAIFQKLGIEHQIVLTCDRTERHIDRSFENWNSADEFLFYFPSTKKFLAPTLVYLRYPWINPEWASTDAVFCQTTTIGNYTTAIAVIKKVPLEDVNQSFIRDESVIRFNDRLDSLVVDIKESLGGYFALGSRAAYVQSNPEERKTMMKEVARAATGSEKILSSSVENDKIEDDNDNKPFVIGQRLLTDAMLENAGKNILVKLGVILGPQIEMYQEKPRQFPMELDYPHTLERVIDFVVPKGYTIKNPGDLNIQRDFKTGGVTDLGFTTEYKMEGDTLHIHILETYRKTDYPLTEYENFKSVVNAAADFSKVTLVLIPK